MKTQKLTNKGYRIALLISFLISCPTYAVLSDTRGNTLYLPTRLKDTKKTIKGTIKDSSGVLIGAIIQVKDTDNATISDLEGNFSLEVNTGDILVVSYIGYLTKEITITSSNVYNILLSQDKDVLDEVVINAGYYSVKDRERTGSIARVTAKDIEFQPVVNPLQAIQGRVAGVDITQNSGVAGGGMSIEIRGRNFLGNSASGRNSPMYIIDGVPFISSSLGINNGSLGLEILQGGISALNAINPSDIESIEILKDADATAIYGSRGANGVILITTKKGKPDKTRFTVSSSVGFSKVAKFMDMMNTEQYLQMRKEAFENSGITSYPVNAYDLNGTWDTNRYTNWQKELIGDTAIDQNISLGINGGSDNTMFNINLSHNENTTVFPTDKGYKRNNMLLALNHFSKDNKFKLNASSSYSTQENNLPTLDLTKQALSLAPNAPALFNENGDLNWQNGTFINPLAQLNQTYENNIKTLVINSNASYQIYNNVFFKVNAGISNNNLEEYKLIPHTIFNPALGRTSENSEAHKANQDISSFIVEPQLQYKAKLNKHTLDFLIGGTFQGSKSTVLQLTGRNFTTDAMIKNISAAKEKYIGNSATAHYKYASLFTRLNYTYDNKYILNITARRDGSSRFAKNNRYGNFGALGTAWLFSEENFFKDVHWLSFGKIRLSYGVTGSDNIGDYAYLDTYSVNSTSYDKEIGLFPSALYNPDYKWEKTTKFESALEFSLFNNRIHSSIAYYNNRATDQLVGLTLPTTTGFNSILTNFLAIVDNRGWEFTVNTQNISNKHWNWSTNINFSIPKNKLVSYPGLEQGTQSTSYIVGKPINIIKLYEFKGINPETGMYEFTDFNNDGKINAEDKKIVKSLNPSFFGGIQNTVSYKSFTLDFLFYFKKQENYNLNNYYATPGGAINNLPVQMVDRWTKENLNAQYISAFYNKPENQALSSPFRESSNSISDASFIRLKNISLSYVLKIPKVKIESLRIYFQGQNLWTITSYKGMDPEFTTFGYLPPLKTYSMGMQLTF